MNTKKQKTKGGHCAMLRVWSDVLMAANTRQVTLLCLLDLSAVFDCVDHDLSHRLQRTFGIRGVALEWICSFPTDRTQQIAYGGQLSTPCLLPFGVPQGSVLGPLLTDCTHSALLTNYLCR